MYNKPCYNISQTPASLCFQLTAAMQAKPAAGAVAGTGTATATGLENGAEKEGGGSSS